MKNILILSKYSAMGASSRYRFFQYIPYLKSQGYEITVSPFFNDQYLINLYRNKKNHREILKAYIKRIITLLNTKRYDVIWIEKEALPYMPFFIEKIFLRKFKYIVDFDDAQFHMYDLSKSNLIRRVLGTKIDDVMENSEIVVVGNEYLKARAIKAGAKNIKRIPTVIDSNKYKMKSFIEKQEFIIGWIGSPSTQDYLKTIEKALLNLNEKFNFSLHLIGAHKSFTIGNINIKHIEWSEKNEVDEMCKFDVGIMPLPDTPWTNGKCGFKLIQYMGCGIPVVASPVGINREIVREGLNGYLANNASEWEEALFKLYQNKLDRENMGIVGRGYVDNEYSLKIQEPIIGEIIGQISNSIK